MNPDLWLCGMCECDQKKNNGATHAHTHIPTEFKGKQTPGMDW